MHKGNLLEWTNECETKFEKLKETLVSPLILQYPDFTNENKFIINTDAAEVALG